MVVIFPSPFAPLNLVFCICSEDLTTFLNSDIFISLPTFIIAECVLIYLGPDSNRSIVGWASQKFTTAVFYLYEQVNAFPNLKYCFLSTERDSGRWGRGKESCLQFSVFVCIHVHKIYICRLSAVFNLKFLAILGSYFKA